MRGRVSEVDAVVSRLDHDGGAGWPLVMRARRLVHQRFRFYSCLSWWESPATALARGRGYCAQYNGALYEVLRRSGVECRLVHAFRVRLRDDPSWRIGHVWVRVRVDGESRDACAGSAGDPIRFEPVTRVRPFGTGMRLLTVVGMAPIVAVAVTRSALTRQPRPTWLHHPLD